MSGSELCEGCPNRGTIKCGVVRSVVDRDSGFGILTDGQGGMTDVLDLARETEGQVTTDTLRCQVENCEGPQEVNQEKGFIRRIGEKLHIIKRERFCPALGALAVSDIRKVPPVSLEKLRKDTNELRIITAFIERLKQFDQTRPLR